MTTVDDPDRFEAAKARFLAGLACLQDGRPAEAEPQFEASLALLPGRASTLVNLAATRLQLGRLDAALEAAGEVLASAPDDLDALLHQGTALARLGRLAQAEASFERLLSIDGTRPLAWLLLGQVRQDLGKIEPALAAYDRALALAPTLAAAWTNRGGLLRELQRPQEAAQAFEQAIAHGGDADLHRYYLAAVGAGDAPTRAPAVYVQGLFDQYAEGFDEHLVAVLRYQAPQRLVQLLREAPGAPAAGLDSALDLGCGTGLCGPLLRPLVRRLVGLDLSAGMLERARARGVYDELLQADLLEHLRQTTERHPLVVACDVFIYFGELAPVFEAVHRVLQPGGCFAFSVERTPDGAQAHALQPSLRYAHAAPELRARSAACGFRVLAQHDGPIREDQRQPIPGGYWLLQRD